MNRFVSLLTLVFLLPLTVCAWGQTKPPVPSDSAQQTALALVNDVYGEEYKIAKTGSEKQALARKMIASARETRDPAGRYVLLRVAKDIAKDGKDGLTAFQAIQEMNRMFAVDPVKMKASVLKSMSDRASVAAQHKWIAEQSLGLVDAVEAKNDYAAATKLAAMAEFHGKRALDKRVLEVSRKRAEEISTLSAVYGTVRPAVQTLETDPANADANLAVGKFYCFYKGDWARGLSMLALGDDETLKALAIRELEGPSGHGDQKTLGDAWWDLSKREDEEGIPARKLRARAAYRYQKALPGLSGLEKQKVESRMDEERRSRGEPYVVAEWRRWAWVTVKKKKKKVQVEREYPRLILYSNGRVTSPDGAASWRKIGLRLTVKWPNNTLPGGFCVDSLLLSSDGKAFRGENSFRTPVRGELVRGRLP